MYPRGGHDGRSSPPAKLVEFLANNPFLPKRPPPTLTVHASTSAEACNPAPDELARSSPRREPIEPGVSSQVHFGSVSYPDALHMQ
eukprot:6183309-Pleurochrysis_carterae.AAC.1